MKIFFSDNYPPGRVKERRKITDKKSLNISSLHADYLNLVSSSGFGRNNETANTVKTKCIFEVIITLQKNVSKVFNRKRFFFQNNWTGKGKISYGWSFDQQANIMDISKMF